MNNINIVPMTADHLEELEKLETALLFPALVAARCWPRSWKTSAPPFWLPQDGDTGKVVGYAGLLVVADEGYITNVAVFPEYRRRGVAAQLLHVFLTASPGAIIWRS